MSGHFKPLTGRLSHFPLYKFSFCRMCFSSIILFQNSDFISLHLISVCQKIKMTLFFFEFRVFCLISSVKRPNSSPFFFFLYTCHCSIQSHLCIAIFKWHCSLVLMFLLLHINYKSVLVILGLRAFVLFPLISFPDAITPYAILWHTIIVLLPAFTSFNFILPYPVWLTLQYIDNVRLMNLSDRKENGLSSSL